MYVTDQGFTGDAYAGREWSYSGNYRAHEMGSEDPMEPEGPPEEEPQPKDWLFAIPQPPKPPIRYRWPLGRRYPTGFG